MKKIGIIALLLILVLLCSCGKAEEAKSESTTPEADAVYALVNGEEITFAETEYFKTRYKSDIINDYAEKYGVEDFADFWDKDFDGTTPAQALEKRAFDEAVSAKIKLVLMRENGIYEDISFAALKQKALDYNAQHKNKGADVGIKTVDLNSFYTYYISTGEMELKNRLAGGELKPTEEELNAVKEKNPELTENGLIDAAVAPKYKKYIAGKIKNAKITKVG